MAPFSSEATQTLLIVAQMWKQQTNNAKEFEHVNFKKDSVMIKVTL